VEARDEDRLLWTEATEHRVPHGWHVVACLDPVEPVDLAEHFDFIDPENKGVPALAAKLEVRCGARPLLTVLRRR
jgi:hypothetical protein